MKVIKLASGKDFALLEAYLRDRYLESHATDSWLPERLHDILYRVGAQEMDDGRTRSADRIYLWEENGAIQRCKKLGIEKCYVNSFGSRKEFYNAAGFFTETAFSFWYKTLS